MAGWTVKFFYIRSTKMIVKNLQLCYIINNLLKSKILIHFKDTETHR